MDNFSFPGDKSALAAAALLASKATVLAADKAKPQAGLAAQGCNKLSASVMADRQRTACPHCGTASVVRTSVQQTRLTREIVYACMNEECGHTFVGLLEVVRTLSPSATPDPGINLPLSSHVRRDLLQAQLAHARSAEHQTRNTAPITGDLFAVHAAANAPPD